MKGREDGRGRVITGRRYKRTFHNRVRRTVVLVQWFGQCRTVFVRTKNHPRPILKGVHVWKPRVYGQGIVLFRDREGQIEVHLLSEMR